MNKKVMEALKNAGVPVSYIEREKVPVSISFFIGNGIPVNHNDDEFSYIEYTIQIDIWAKYGNSIEQLQKDVINLMISAGFELSNIVPDLYESELKILHKALEFKFLEEVEKGKEQ